MAAKALARQWVGKFVMSLAALVVIALTGTIFAFPAVAAVACPTCYGLDRLDSKRGQPNGPSPALPKTLPADTAAENQIHNCVVGQQMSQFDMA